VKQVLKDESKRSGGGANLKSLEKV
jgi:hypothetical protein